MSRMRTTGVLVTTLAAALPGCGDDDNHCLLDTCGSACVDTLSDPANCGACDNPCDSNSVCSGGMCMPSSLQCTAPEVACGSTCVDTQTDAANCGGCGTACGTDIACVTGHCAVPLALTRTFDATNQLARDAFVIQDGTFTSTRLGTATVTATDRVTAAGVLQDGRVVLIGDEEATGTFELWLSSPTGGALTRLNATLPSGANVTDFAVSKDGTRVLYRADAEVDGELDLYAVAVASPGAAVHINGTLPTGSNVSRVFSVSDDGTRATYLADQNTPGFEQLFTVDLTAATPTSVQLSPNAIDTSIWDFQTNADGTRVVYRVDPAGAPQLFVVDVANPGVEQVLSNSTVASYRANDDYRLTPDGSAVIYSGSDGSFQEALWAASTVGPVFDSIQLVPSTGISNMVRDTLTIAGGFVYFRQDNPTTGMTEVLRLDLANPTTPVAVFDSATSAIDADSFAVSPDGKHLAFGAFGDGGEGGFQSRGIDGPPSFVGGNRHSFEIYGVDVSGALPATPVRIAAINSKGALGVSQDYFVKNDGRVVFRGDLDVNQQTEVYIGHPAAPDTVLKISPDLATNAATTCSALASF